MILCNDSGNLIIHAQADTSCENLDTLFPFRVLNDLPHGVCGDF